ncbi:unnamed protein product [Closterium sp. Naga37s-1]|nr:unnamed protein product [Closterium sp. Naga37s-1]
MAQNQSGRTAAARARQTAAYQTGRSAQHSDSQAEAAFQPAAEFPLEAGATLAFADGGANQPGAGAASPSAAGVAFPTEAGAPFQPAAGQEFPPAAGGTFESDANAFDALLDEEDECGGYNQPVDLEAQPEKEPVIPEPGYMHELMENRATESASPTVDRAMFEAQAARTRQLERELMQARNEMRAMQRQHAPSHQGTGQRDGQRFDWELNTDADAGGWNDAENSAEANGGLSGGAGAANGGPSGGDGVANGGPSGGAGAANFGRSVGAGAANGVRFGTTGAANGGPSVGAGVANGGPSVGAGVANGGPSVGAGAANFGPSVGAGAANGWRLGAAGVANGGPSGGAGAANGGRFGAAGAANGGRRGAAVGNSDNYERPMVLVEPNRPAIIDAVNNAYSNGATLDLHQLTRMQRTWAHRYAMALASVPAKHNGFTVGHGFLIVPYKAFLFSYQAISPPLAGALSPPIPPRPALPSSRGFEPLSPTLAGALGPPIPPRPALPSSRGCEVGSNQSHCSSKSLPLCLTPFLPVTSSSTYLLPLQACSVHLFQPDMPYPPPGPCAFGTDRLPPPSSPANAHSILLPSAARQCPLCPPALYCPPMPTLSS